MQISIVLVVALSAAFLAVRSEPDFIKLPAFLAVRSAEPSLIKLPSDQRQENDLCPVFNPKDMGLCPVKCFRPDPVCGSDGVTYWCGCADAHCAGVRVKKSGFCEVGNGGSGPAGQALLLVHIVWLILLGVLVLFGLF